MKKLLLILTGAMLVSFLNAQSLEEIIKKYTAANKLDQVSKLQTIKISAKMSLPAMGMEMPMNMLMKNPNKIKTVTSIQGQEMVQVFDGEKGYMINPMTGSTAPVEMSASDVMNMTRSNMFSNYLANYYKEGKLTLAGEEAVNGAQAYKLKAAVDGGATMELFIDKNTYMIIKTTVNTTSEGMAVTVETYPGDYKEFSGLIVPMKTKMSTMGMEMEMIFTSVEVNVPIDDAVFKVK